MHQCKKLFTINYLALDLMMMLIIEYCSPKFTSINYFFYLHNQYCPLRLNVTEVNQLWNQIHSLRPIKIDMILANRASVCTINIIRLKIRVV